MENDMKRHWEEKYQAKGGHRTVGSPAWSEKKYLEIQRRFEPVLETLLAEYAAGKRRVLDFGCGIGRWRSALKKHFTEYYACDIVDQLEREEGDNFQCIENGKIPFDDRKFDCIFTCVVLQHVVEDESLRSIIRQFHERLGDAGILLITENTTTGIANHGDIRYRSVYQYKNIFTDCGFNLQWVHTHLFDREEHGIFVGRRMTWTGS